MGAPEVTRVLLLGGAGQVGAELQRSRPADWTLIAPKRDELDLQDLNSMKGKLVFAKPDAIINAAAYTAVDSAEDEPALAFAINQEAPQRLAEFAGEHSIPLVHISTDYVFDGRKRSPYRESDPINPLGVYGRSKAGGERAVLALSAGAAVVRTSWVFSANGANFVKTMLRLGSERSAVRVVADQHGRPTPARDLASACIEIAKRLLTGDDEAAGLFHFAGEGETTWAGFAEAIFAEAQKRGRGAVEVEPISTPEYPTRAQRPLYSVLDTAKIERLGLKPRPWIEGLGDCLDALIGAHG